MSVPLFKFTITTPFEVQESLTDKIILRGTFIRLNIPTSNGRIYQVDEAEQIAKDLIGKPVYYGASEGGLHRIGDEYVVGKVIEAIADKINEIIRGAITIWNNSKFPDLISKVKKGWGFSIGGVVQKFLPTGILNERLKPILHAIGMRANHIALLEPTTRRGDAAAQAEELIPVNESLQIDPCPFEYCMNLYSTKTLKRREEHVWILEDSAARWA